MSAPPLSEQILSNRIDLLEARIRDLEMLQYKEPKESFKQRCTCNDGLTNAACPVHPVPGASAAL